MNSLDLWVIRVGYCDNKYNKTQERDQQKGVGPREIDFCRSFSEGRRVSRRYGNRDQRTTLILLLLFFIQGVRVLNTVFVISTPIVLK